VRGFVNAMGPVRHVRHASRRDQSPPARQRSGPAPPDLVPPQSREVARCLESFTRCAARPEGIGYANAGSSAWAALARGERDPPGNEGRTHPPVNGLPPQEAPVLPPAPACPCGYRVWQGMTALTRACPFLACRPTSSLTEFGCSRFHHDLDQYTFLHFGGIQCGIFYCILSRYLPTLFLHRKEKIYGRYSSLRVSVSTGFRLCAVILSCSERLCCK
jgi:hypothetical protein